MADGGAVVAGHVVLVAEDDGHGAVRHALVGKQHRLLLGADGTLAAVHELDGAAQRLLRFARQHAVRVEVAHGAPSSLVRDVVEVALLGGMPQVARVDVEARVVAAQVGVEPRVRAARAQHGVAHLHAGALASYDARVVERDPSVVERLRDGDVHPRIGAGEHAQSHAHDARARRGRIERDGQRQRRARSGHHVDGSRVGSAVHALDAHRCAGALVRARGQHDGLARHELEVFARLVAHAGGEDVGRGEVAVLERLKLVG